MLIIDIGFYWRVRCEFNEATVSILESSANNAPHGATVQELLRKAVHHVYGAQRSVTPEVLGRLNNCSKNASPSHHS